MGVTFYEWKNGVYEPVAKVKDGELVEDIAGIGPILADMDLSDERALRKRFDGPQLVAAQGEPPSAEPEELE